MSSQDESFLRFDDEGLTSIGTADLVCFSHLRWNFVFQRPQHLLSRFARDHRVFFFEEPVYEAISAPQLNVKLSPENVFVATPILPEDLREESNRDRRHAHLRSLLDSLLDEKECCDLTLWYYTPMALQFTDHLEPRAIVYDCMDELSLFKHAPPELLPLERDLLSRAHVVFTGGHSLYEAKQHLHRNIHPFPSSIEFDHFAKARNKQEIEPEDQSTIAHPRVGFYGVIDERFDIDLLGAVAKLRPDIQFVMIGPVVKIDPAHLPKSDNIHYLGMKSYAELPKYLAGWDAAIMPFAKNDSTRFISPTKTPEFLAAGRPVVSTSIRDVIRPYSEMGLVEIADEPQAFAEALDRALRLPHEDREWIARVDGFLVHNSWDLTQQKMATLVQAAMDQAVEDELVRGLDFDNLARELADSLKEGPHATRPN